MKIIINQNFSNALNGQEDGKFPYCKMTAEINHNQKVAGDHRLKTEGQVACYLPAAKADLDNGIGLLD